MAGGRRRFGACHSVNEFADTMLGSLASPRRTTLLEAKRRLSEKMGVRSIETERMELPDWGLMFQGDRISVMGDEQGSVNDDGDGYTALGACLSILEMVLRHSLCAVCFISFQRRIME